MSSMEIETDRNIHYLHPDFEEINENKEKKPSPLALLAQTCQSIGTGKELKNSSNRDKSCSPNSTSTNPRRSTKRSNSDYLSNASNSPNLERVYSPPSKRSKPTAEIERNCNRVESTHADTSTDLGKEINQSLMHSFMNFLKNSNNSQQSYTDKLEFLYFLTNRFTTHDQNLMADKSKEISHFNISNGYHLKNQISESSKPPEDNQPNVSPMILNVNSESVIDQSPTSVSTIKYCMYCGKLIPLLPMLLAHIRIDHAKDQFPDIPAQNFSQVPSLCDFLTKFNPYNLSNQVKTTQSSSVPSLTNYINNWSSLLGYDNLIF